MMVFQLYSSISLILFSYISMKSLALESHSETVETTRECKRLFTDPNELPKSTLEVFYMYGPCSPAAVAGTSPMNMPSAQDILHHDQQRVQFLQARFKHNKHDSQFQDTKEAANFPVLFSKFHYAITINLGTPQQELTLFFDTGSDISWSRVFNPYASTSLKIITCDGHICPSFLPDCTCEMFCNIKNTCYYKVIYNSGPYSKGVLSKDILIITQTSDVIPEFLFGCPIDVQSTMNVDGILGLGKGPLSFLTQTEPIYNRIFSYCFPSTPSSTGFLKLGRRNYQNNVKFTSLLSKLDHPSFYFINLISIKVGHVDLSIDLFELNHPGTIIDTATVITRLPIYTYKTMSKEFQDQMRSLSYQTVESPNIFFDTCYDNKSGVINIVPTITFTFEGYVDVVMDGSATLYALDESNIVCLAFSGNSDPDKLTIFGNTQQKKLEVVYDVERKRLGFIPDGCL